MDARNQRTMVSTNFGINEVQTVVLLLLFESTSVLVDIVQLELVRIGMISKHMTVLNYQKIPLETLIH